MLAAHDLSRPTPTIAALPEAPTADSEPASNRWLGCLSTSRPRHLWVALVAATAIAAVFTTPAILAGIALHAID
jgi:hypothetical protein